MIEYSYLQKKKQKMSQGFSANPNPYVKPQDYPPPSPNPYSQPLDTSTDMFQPPVNNLPLSQDIRRSFLQDSYGVDANQLKSKNSSKHVRSLIATIILVIGLVTFPVLYSNGTLDVSLGGLIGICVAVYLFYLILGLCCNTLFGYFGHVQHGVNFQGAYNRVRSLTGHFHFSVVCYHYQTRYHTRTVTDSNGNTKTQTYTTQQKVITHTASQDVHPRSCTDDSGQVGQILSSTDIIFVHNKVNYRFLDEHSRREFEYRWYSFQNRNRFDVHQDYSQNFVIPGLVARVCFYVGERPKNYRCLLVLSTLFGCIWPYSMFLEGKISRFDIEYMKVVGL